MLQCRFQLLPVALMCRSFDVVKNSSAREQQTFPFVLDADLLFRTSPTLGGALDCCGLHLRLD